MSFNYEIIEQIGFARMGKLHTGEKNYPFPLLLCPYNENLPFIQEEEPIVALLQNSSNWMGVQIEDNLQILGLRDLKRKSHLEHPNIQRRIQFYQSNEFWGFSSENFIEFANNQNPPIEKANLLSKRIFILKENFAKTAYYRYEIYEDKALEARLDYYKSMIFPHLSESRFVLEFSFSKNHIEKLDTIISWINNNRERIIGIKIVDLFSNLGDFNSILQWILKMKRELPSNLIWMIGGKILIHDYALAIYLGFDMIDVGYLIQWGYKGLYITPSYSNWVRNIKYPECSCPICINISSKFPKDRETLDSIGFRNQIVQHNLFTAIQELNSIKNSLNQGTLRTYLEKKIHENSYSVSILRVLDKKFSQDVCKRYPLVASHPVQCIGPESYVRPEVLNFIQKVQHDIFPAKDYKIIIIFPCSSKKPYSSSKSHRSFRKAMRNAVKTHKTQIKIEDIHEIILTSPLGVVPRELESIFPASHYDIPVTGDWDHEETELTANCLAHWLEKYSPENTNQLIVISHLLGGYKESCKLAEKMLRDNASKKETTQLFEFIYTLSDHSNFSASSKEGIALLEKSLENTIQKYFEDKDKDKDKDMDTDKDMDKDKDKDMDKDMDKDIKNKDHHFLTSQFTLKPQEIHIRAVFDYQFGKGAGDLVVKNGVMLLNTRNPYHDDVVMYDGAGKLLLGRLWRDTGLIKLSATGAQALYDQGLRSRIVKLTDETIRGSTVFIPILDSVSEDAHPNDEMFIVNKNEEIIGVGSLVAISEDLQTCNYGKVCAIRKKIN